MDYPYTLIAELTYRCPLACPYCSNPVQYEGGTPLSTDEWRRIFREAESLGVVQLNLTGGEPLLRKDLSVLILEARRLELYVNLITSGTPVDYDRLARLRDCGLDSIQLSIQAADAELCDRLAGRPVYEHKLAVARWAAWLGLPLTLNVVLHRDNLHEVPALIALAEQLGVERLELATVQYHGWAMENRDALLPARAQLDAARAAAGEAKRRLGGMMEVIFVFPDYYADVPRTCMDGWGRRYVVVTPDGLVLPCLSAHTIPTLPLEHATHRPLREIWEESALFNVFRGEAWMPDTCRQCDRRSIDYGGCRCQAFHLTQDVAAMDPACRLSPHHAVIQAARVTARRADAPRLLQPRSLRRVP